MQSWLLPRRQHWWWRFRSCSSLDECIQLFHVHLIHYSWRLQWYSQHWFLQMWVEDWCFHWSGLNLPISFSLRAVVHLSSLQSLLHLVCLRLTTGEASSQPSLLQFLHYIASRLYQQDWDQRFDIPAGWSRASTLFATLFGHSHHLDQSRCP